MKIILKRNNDIYLNGDFFQNKWKNNKNIIKSEMLQDDSKSGKENSNGALEYFAKL